MSRAHPIQTNFTAGSISPRAHGRVDINRYGNGAKEIQNFVIQPQGGLIRPSGTRFIYEVKDSTKKTRLIEFEFSTTQSYVIEIGNLYFRFYKDEGIIVSGPPVEVVHTYTEAQLFDLNFTQSADVLYITHPSHPPRKLTRTSHTAWTLTDIAFIDGPYLDQNITATTLTASATTGAITITASAALWSANDVGRWVRIKSGSTWGCAKITGYTSTTVVNATVQTDFPVSTSALTTWRLGSWYIGNYPSTVSFYEERLTFANSPIQPQTIWMSTSVYYETFSPTTAAAVVLDSSGITYTIGSNQVNSIRWLAASSVLLVGTIGGEWRVKSGSVSQPLSPTNVQVSEQSGYGSSKVRHRRIGNSIVFVQRSARKVLEFLYSFEIDGYQSKDASLLGEHLLRQGGGIVDAAYQKEPYSIWWGVRYDGALIGMTFLKEQEIVGWHKHILGGTLAGSDFPQVESVACIPNVAGSADQLWMIVKRTINGTTKRYVEVIEDDFAPADATDKDNAFFVHSGLTLDSPLTITGATKASPCVVTAASHGFSNGNTVRIKSVKGMTELNNRDFVVANVAANTFELTNPSTAANIDSSAYTTYISGGEARKKVTAISGLSHLEGETVHILADGATHPTKTVSGGAITLDRLSAIVHVGLQYKSVLTNLPIEGGGNNGTAQGKIKRTHRVVVRLLETLGLKYKSGEGVTGLSELSFRSSSGAMDASPSLFTGDVEFSLDQSYVRDGIFTIVQEQPLPMTILALMPEGVVHE